MRPLELEAEALKLEGEAFNIVTRCAGCHVIASRHRNFTSVNTAPDCLEHFLDIHFETPHTRSMSITYQHIEKPLPAGTSTLHLILR